MRGLVLLLLIMCGSIYTALAQWEKVFHDEDAYLRGIHFLNQDTGFVAGSINFGQGYSGVILKTVNGGQSWDTTYTGEPSFVPRDIDFVSPDTGYAGGQDGALWRTFDGGESWEYFSHLPFLHDIYEICFLNSQNGFVERLQTSNGGFIWDPFDFGWINQFAKMNDTDLYCAWEDGVIATTDLGSTWDTLLYNEDYNFNSIDVVNESIIYACNNNQHIYKTIDCGNNWNLVSTSPMFEINNIQFLSEEIGYASCNYNASALARMIKTTDEGQFWSPILFPDAKIQGFQFLNESIGYVLSPISIYKTTNGGGEIQEPQLIDANWVSTIHSNANLKLYGSDADNNGNLYFCGSFSDTLYYKDTLLTIPPNYAENGLYLGRVSKNGKIHYMKYLEPEEYSPVPLKVNPANNHCVLYKVSGTNDPTLEAFNEVGESIYTKTINGGSLGSSFCIGHNGNMMVVGTFTGSLEYENVMLETEWTSIYMLKTDPTGALIDFEILGKGGMLNSKLIIDQDSNIYIAAKFFGPLIFGNDTIIQLEELKSLVLKFDSFFDYEWSYDPIFIESSVEFSEIITDSINCPVIAGNNIKEGFLIKLNPDGEELYAYLFDWKSQITSTSIAPYNHVIVTGDFQGILKIGNDSIASYGNQDQFFLEIDSDGNLVNLNQTWNSHDAGHIISFFNSYFLTGTYKHELQLNNQFIQTGFSKNIFILNSGEIPNSIQTQAQTELFSIFPNPTNRYLNIMILDDKTKLKHATIFNIDGKIVHSISFRNVRQTVDLQHIKPGMYFIKLETKNKLSVNKFILK